MNRTVSLCAPHELTQVYDLINARIRWMDEMGICQWNTVNYWEAYPKSHYERAVEAGCLYVLREQGRIAGALVLKEEDPYWDDGASACYIHNLATALDARGAGAQLLETCGRIASERGKKFLRLDCALSNQRLNDYYEALGFSSVCDFLDGTYHGIKRQKLL